jgi:hypothetical protein
MDKLDMLRMALMITVVYYSRGTYNCCYGNDHSGPLLITPVNAGSCWSMVKLNGLIKITEF